MVRDPQRCVNAFVVVHRARSTLTRGALGVLVGAHAPPSAAHGDRDNDTGVVGAIDHVDAEPSGPRHHLQRPVTYSRQERPELRTTGAPVVAYADESLTDRRESLSIVTVGPSGRSGGLTRPTFWDRRLSPALDRLDSDAK